jgi:hypothetical protein
VILEIVTSVADFFDPFAFQFENNCPKRLIDKLVHLSTEVLIEN